MAGSYEQTLYSVEDPVAAITLSRPERLNAGTDCSPASLQVMKRQVESFSRPDFEEGVQSFLERRPPKFPHV